MKGRISHGQLQLPDQAPGGDGDGFSVNLALPHLLLAPARREQNNELFSGFWLILGTIKDNGLESHRPTDEFSIGSLEHHKGQAKPWFPRVE